MAGCHTLLMQGPGSADAWSRIRGEVRGDETGVEELILVDRTGQPVSGPAGHRVVDDNNPTADGVTASRTTESISRAPLAISATSARAAESAGGAISGGISQDLNRMSAWSDFDLDLELNAVPAVSSAGMVAPQSPERSLERGSNLPTAASRARVTQGQSFRVQVTDERADEPQGNATAWDASQQAREEAKAEAMIQAVQRVTQQGMSRLSGAGSNSTASPALANLLMEQVQGSLSEQQIQQAHRELDSWEGLEMAPAFDLRGNRQAFGPQSYRPASLGSDTGGRLALAGGSAEDDGNVDQPVRSIGSTDAATILGRRIATTDSSGSNDSDQEHWRMALQKAIVAVERAIPQAAHPQEQQSLEIYLRLLRLLAGDTDQAVGTIEVLPKDRQVFWREQIFALSQIVQTPAEEQEAMLVNHSRQATKALAHMHNAIQALQNEATLQLRQVQFCQEIRSFGDYDRAKATVVAAGDPMLIYCEVINYRSERISDGNGESFQTNLVPSYQIFDDRQRVVSQKEFAIVRDQCRSRRQDFYLVLQLEVPNLPRGKYHVQVSVEDVEGGKIAVSVPLSFQVR